MCSCRAVHNLSRQYCLIVPGDTASTAMTTRALLGGCVPVFVSDDWRELPFASILNYSAFSVRVHERELVATDGAAALVHELRATVSDSRYEQLAAGLADARDYFDYARDHHGPRSPFGAALASAVLDAASAHHGGHLAVAVSDASAFSHLNER